MSKNGSITPNTVHNNVELINFTDVKKKLEEYSKNYSEQFIKDEVKKYTSIKDFYKKIMRSEINKGFINRCLNNKNVPDNNNKLEEYNKSWQSILNQNQVEESKCCFIKFYQHNGKGELSISSPVVFHYAINNEKIKLLEGNIIVNGTLHPIEQGLFNEAISHLSKKQSAEAVLKRGNDFVTRLDCADN